MFASIRPGDLSEVTIVGDSLTSDIQGANNAGLDCVWYNPGKLRNNSGLRITKTVSCFDELEKYLCGEDET